MSPKLQRVLLKRYIFCNINIFFQIIILKSLVRGIKLNNRPSWRMSVLLIASNRISAVIFLLLAN